MESKGIVESLENKTILVTGATGFLAKIFVEKVLRIQPSVKKLFLLLRAADVKLAVHRMHTEVVGNELFGVLKEKYGASFESFVSSKVTTIAADISLKNLGIENYDLREFIWKEVDIIINAAASTKFNERYDVALGTNTSGVKNVLDFAKNCGKLSMLLHVSTAYVCGEKSGLILEKPLVMGETLNGTSGLDIDQELKLVEERLNELEALGATKEAKTVAMKDLGIERAKLYGWPNTYVLTKAMGEVLIGELGENLPVVIVRPTVITSTYREPFPGWMEGVRTIDSVIVGYGKGKLKCFPGDSESILDVIPGDMVVNVMMLSMIANANENTKIIYQVGSSFKNPLNFGFFNDCMYNFFSKNPWTDKNGRPVTVRPMNLFDSMASFNRHMTRYYIYPLKGLQLLNAVLFQYLHPICNDLSRQIKFVQRFAKLYAPYTFFKGIFDDTNLEKLRKAMESSEREANAFYFDPKLIDWEEYFTKIHFPGIVRRVF